VEGGGTSEEGTNRPRSVSSLLILLRAMVPLIEYGARKESCLVDLVVGGFELSRWWGLPNVRTWIYRACRRK